MNQIHGKHHVHCFAVALSNDNIVIALDCRAYLFNGLLQFVANASELLSECGATLDRQGGRIETIERALHKNGDMDDRIREA